MKHALLKGAVLCVPILSLAPAALAQGMPGGMAGMAMPAKVGYVVLKPQTVPQTRTLPARVVAYSSAEVRPQVGGIITSVSVTEGQTVTKGDVLFTIDDAVSKAQVDAAQAALASAEAALPNAQSKADRYQKLVGTGGVAQSDLDTANAELLQARASVESAKAQLAQAKITLSETQVTAPISGTVGTVNTEIGQLVTASQSAAMTTIRMTDPIYVTLAESYDNLLALRMEAGATGTPPKAPKVTLTLDDGSSFDQTGTISSADFVVSESTGTMTLRATFPNPQHVLLPGMFVRAQMELGQLQDVFLVPQRAVSFDASGNPTAYFVTAENKVEKRELSTGEEYAHAWVVTKGIAAGDKLIVDGLQKISDGASVIPAEVTISDDGVVYQDLAADLAATAAAMAGAGASAPAAGGPATGSAGAKP